MPRMSVLSVPLLFSLLSACAVDTPSESSDLESNAAALSAAGSPAPSLGRACGPGARTRFCPKGEVCDHSANRWVGRCHSPTHAPRCGDGTVSSGEACDDGNTRGGDGCSASCQFDDNTSTPGDDRPGFVDCGTLACSAGTLCCSGTCLAGATDCGVPINGGNKCDGAEDCPAGELCLEGRGGHHCAMNGGGESVVCHKESECTGVICPFSGNPCPHCAVGVSGDYGTCFANN